MSGQQQRDPRGKDHLFWKGEKMIRQSKTDFYVCIRRRDEFGSDASSPLEARWPKGRLGAYQGIEAAHKGYCEAIDEYGPEYRVVIEPVEWVES